MSKEIMILICGIYSLGFAVLHVFFWRLFNWKIDLQKLSPENRATMQIFNLRMIYIFMSVGALCILLPYELIHTNLGKVLLLGISIFWLGRAIEQFIFFKVKSVKVDLFTILFFLGALLFILPLFPFS